MTIKANATGEKTVVWSDARAPNLRRPRFHLVIVFSKVYKNWNIVHSEYLAYYV